MDQINKFINEQSTIDKLLAFANGTTRMIAIQLIQTLSNAVNYSFIA